MAASARQEQAWVREAQGGSASAFEALFRLYWPQAFRAAFLVVHDRLNHGVARRHLHHESETGHDEAEDRERSGEERQAPADRQFGCQQQAQRKASHRVEAVQQPDVRAEQEETLKKRLTAQSVQSRIVEDVSSDRPGLRHADHSRDVGVKIVVQIEDRCGHQQEAGDYSRERGEQNKKHRFVPLLPSGVSRGTSAGSGKVVPRPGLEQVQRRHQNAGGQQNKENERRRTSGQV